MQGQEFDYVIVDNIDLSVDLDGPNSYDKVTFLRRFYTLMSRGKTASIFQIGDYLDLLEPIPKMI